MVQDKTFEPGVGTSPLPPVDPGSDIHEKPTIAIMSFGEMGMGIASLLKRYCYPLVTNLDGRSAKTLQRAKSLNVKVLPLDRMLAEASIFLSIVPPAEALALANTVAEIYNASEHSKFPMQYVDLNAISPDLCRQIQAILSPVGIKFIDGAIIGFPPKELPDKRWFRPSIPVSGPTLSNPDDPWSEQLLSLLNIRQVGDAIGNASCLKMCFGAIYKGQAAITMQAYTTAYCMGVLEPLREHMEEYFPGTKSIIESSMYGAQRKGYRWIKEMEEVEATFVKYGGWRPELFAGVADVFRLMSEKTNLENQNRDTVEEIRPSCVLHCKKTDDPSERSSKYVKYFNRMVWTPQFLVKNGNPRIGHFEDHLHHEERLNGTHQ